MDLRDRFAAHFAAALVDAFADAGDVARRAYDLAEAMMTERARRSADDERSAITEEPHLASIPPARPLKNYHAALLDEPEPFFEPDAGYDDDLDPRWLEPPYDPSWDIETHWNVEPSPRASSSPPPAAVPGPGLVRTRPEIEEEERKERLG